MSVPRLTFLYPHLFKSVKTSDPSLIRRCSRPLPKKKGRTAGFASTSISKQETYAQRYGPANEPHPPPQLPLSNSPGPGGEEEPKSLSTVIEKEVKTPPSALKQDDQKAQPATDPEKEAEKPTPERPNTSPAPSSSAPSKQATKLDASESHPKEQSDTPTQETTSLGVAEAKPMERLLQMSSPDEEHKPPHLHAPPYIHHFDTFTLVRDLEKGGFTQAQSVTLMKAVRSLLALNLDVAREGLISKSDIENVPLFPYPSFPTKSHNPPINPSCRVGNLPLPRRLFRTTHRNPRPAPKLLHHKSHAAQPPPTRSRHPLATRSAGIPRPER